MAAVVDNNGNGIAGAQVAPVGAAAFNPAATSAAHDAMRDRLWELDVTWGGTEALRDAGEKLLPRFEREAVDDHRKRLRAARLLRNMFRQAVERGAGKLFEVPVRLSDAEEGTVAWSTVVDDCDMRGNSFDRVARDLARDALRRGLSCILVDYPVVTAANLAEERAQNPRPYLVELDPTQVLEAYEDDMGSVTYLRWYDRSLAWDEAAQAVVMTERVQERTPGKRRTWKQVSEAVKTGLSYTTGKLRQSWVLESEGVVSQPRVMFHVLYAEREDFMVARTPLTEVKDLTLEVWEVGSDLKNCIQRVMFPIITVTGIDQKDVGTMDVGPQSILGSMNKDAKFSYLEHTGKAIESGETHIDKLEQRAEVYAGQLTRPTGDVKATQTAVSTAETSSWLRDFGLTTQDRLQAIVDDMALWQPAIGSPRVTVNLDFAVDLPDGDLVELGTARRAGDLSRQTYYHELQRRNVLSTDFSADDNQKQLEDEQAEGMEREKEMMRATAAISAPRQPGTPEPEPEPAGA